VKGPNDSGGPHEPEEPTGEHPSAEDADDSPLARVLAFAIPEVPFDGVLICGGSVYGADLMRLAPVVPIAGRGKRRG